MDICYPVSRPIILIELYRVKLKLLSTLHGSFAVRSLVPLTIK